MASGAPPRAHHPHQPAASHLQRHHLHQHQQHQQQSSVYSAQFYNYTNTGTAGFVDTVSSPPSSPAQLSHFRFPSSTAAGSSAMLGAGGYHAGGGSCHPPPSQHHQKRRPELALMQTRTCYSLDEMEMSPATSTATMGAERVSQLDMR